MTLLEGEGRPVCLANEKERKCDDLREIGRTTGGSWDFILLATGIHWRALSKGAISYDVCLTTVSLLWRVTCGKEGGSKKTSQGCPRESSEGAARVMRSGWILDACWRWSLFDLLMGCEGIKQTVTQDDSWISA